MGKKVLGWLLFGVVLGGDIALTLYAGQDSAMSMQAYNFVFLAIMLGICVIGIAVGFRNMEKLESSFSRASERIRQNFGGEKEKREGSVLKLDKLFNFPALDEKWKSFCRFVASQPGRHGRH